MIIDISDPFQSCIDNNLWLNVSEIAHKLGLDIAVVITRQCWNQHVKTANQSTHFKNKRIEAINISHIMNDLKEQIELHSANPLTSYPLAKHRPLIAKVRYTKQNNCELPYYLITD